jgi:hypothetical protein
MRAYLILILDSNGIEHVRAVVCKNTRELRRITANMHVIHYREFFPKNREKGEIRLRAV